MTTIAEKEFWKIVNEEARDVARRDLSELEEFAKTETRLAAVKLQRLANENAELRTSLLGDAWTKYHRAHSAWMQTYNAALTGAAARAGGAPYGRMTSEEACEYAAYCADKTHGPRPEKPE